MHAPSAGHCHAGQLSLALRKHCAHTLGHPNLLSLRTPGSLQPQLPALLSMPSPIPSHIYNHPRQITYLHLHSLLVLQVGMCAGPLPHLCNSRPGWRRRRARDGACAGHVQSRRRRGPEPFDQPLTAVRQLPVASRRSGEQPRRRVGHAGVPPPLVHSLAPCPAAPLSACRPTTASARRRLPRPSS